MNLTPGERRVLRLLLRFKVNKEIAAELGVTPYAVKFHASNIYHKLGVAGRMELFDQLDRGRKLNVFGVERA